MVYEKSTIRHLILSCGSVSKCTKSQKVQEVGTEATVQLSKSNFTYFYKCL
jgi:hypothetical protein